MSRQKESLQIPRENADLQAYVRKKRLRVWLFSLAWETFWMVVFLYYSHREDMNFDYRFSLVLSALLLFGLFLFGWVRMMLDRSFCGTITHIRYKQVLMMDTVTRHRRMVQQMCLQIEEENGRKRKITMEKKRGFERYYHVGDKITHYRSLPYPESNDGADRHFCVCLLCGGMEMTETDCCHGCGATLIKPPRSRYANFEEKFL